MNPAPRTRSTARRGKIHVNRTAPDYAEALPQPEQQLTTQQPRSAVKLHPRVPAEGVAAKAAAYLGAAVSGYPPRARARPDKCGCRGGSLGPPTGMQQGMVGIGGRRERGWCWGGLALGAMLIVTTAGYAVSQLMRGGLGPADTAGLLGLPLGAAGLVAAVTALRVLHGTDAELVRQWSDAGRSGAGERAQAAPPAARWRYTAHRPPLHAAYGAGRTARAPMIGRTFHSGGSRHRRVLPVYPTPATRHCWRPRLRQDGPGPGTRPSPGRWTAPTATQCRCESPMASVGHRPHSVQTARRTISRKL